jgi:single-strand DNA-binding protein
MTEQAAQPVPEPAVVSRSGGRASVRRPARAPTKVGDTTVVRAVPFRGDTEDNTVLLRGRVSSAPLERELPSGAVITTVRISVPRARTAMTAGSTQTVDWLDCSAWTARTRRSVGSWSVGDPVEVTGALRRRFYRFGEGASSRLEVEVLTARRAKPRDQPSE